MKYWDAVSLSKSTQICTLIHSRNIWKVYRFYGFGKVTKDCELAERKFTRNR